jgi:hypothetical protein
MCVPREALISALVRRAREGDLVSADDVDALLRAGVPAAQLTEAFAGEGAGLEHARTLVTMRRPISS